MGLHPPPQLDQVTEAPERGGSTPEPGLRIFSSGPRASPSLAFDPVAQAGQAVADQADVQVVLAAEMEIERALGHPGPGGDIFHPHFMIVTFREELAGGIQDPCALLGSAVRRTPHSRPHTSGQNPFRRLEPSSLVGWVGAAQPTIPKAMTLVGCAALTHPTRSVPILAVCHPANLPQNTIFQELPETVRTRGTHPPTSIEKSDCRVIPSLFL